MKTRFQMEAEKQVLQGILEILAVRLIDLDRELKALEPKGLYSAGDVVFSQRAARTKEDETHL